MSLEQDPARPTLLTALYRRTMRVTKRRGMRTLSRWNARLFPCGQIIALDTGCEMFIPPDPHFFGYVVGHESHITRLIEEIVVEGDTCVDVGANIGYFSLMMAARCGRTGRVLSYEPEPANFRVLSENVELARRQGLNVSATEAAVAQHGGVVELVRGEESTLHQVRAPEGQGPASSSPLIRCVNLADDLAGKGVSGPIKLVKIDVEGFEVPVLKGVAALLQSGAVRAAVVEVTAGEQAREVESIFGDLHPQPRSVECWLEGSWKPLRVSQIPHRTDILVKF
jgi:FkbM family methyltransferase